MICEVIGLIWRATTRSRCRPADQVEGGRRFAFLRDTRLRPIQRSTALCIDPQGNLAGIRSIAGIRKDNVRVG
jgi:hypothetical protein